VFDKNGKFLRNIGKTGTGPGEFRTPHSVKFDSQGRLIVADRHNHRVQILTKDGKFVAEYKEFSRVSGLRSAATTSSTPPTPSQSRAAIRAGSRAFAAAA